MLRIQQSGMIFRDFNKFKHFARTNIITQRDIMRKKLRSIGQRDKKSMPILDNVSLGIQVTKTLFHIHTENHFGLTPCLTRQTLATRDKERGTALIHGGNAVRAHRNALSGRPHRYIDRVPTFHNITDGYRLRE